MLRNWQQSMIEVGKIHMQLNMRENEWKESIKG